VITVPASVPARLRPSAPIAENAVLTGDPGRAMMLAQELTVQPKMSNHARGLWGYWGVTEDGGELTIQATGTGGPSAALVLTDLAELGLKRAVRVGTCVAADTEFGLGQMIVVASAFAADGVSRSLGNEAVALRPTLIEGLLPATEDGAELSHAGSFDVIPDRDALAGAAFSVADMQTAALFSVAPTVGVEIGALLIVAEDASGERISNEALERSAKDAGRAAAAALST
jgi:uridine phosphorylase